jgi:hypothetical protein
VYACVCVCVCVCLCVPGWTGWLICPDVAVPV